MRGRRELSWSLSRARMFEECPRRFYYAYYFAQAGYHADAPVEAVLALEMKSIKGLDMWVGEVVHQTIEWALERTRGGSLPTREEALEETRRTLSEGWKASLRRLWRKQPGDRCPNLFEHYYEIEVGKAVTDRLKEKALTSVGNFMDSEIFRQIAETPAERWLPIEKFACFRLDGLLMYIKFDFALKDGERLTIYDWKTGKPTGSESRQLACYAMYTSQKWSLPMENIKVCAVHLQPSLIADERLVSHDDLEETRDFIKASFNGMVKSLRNPARNIAVMEDFPMSGNYIRCARCNFKGICEQGSLAEADDAPMEDDWE